MAKKKQNNISSYITPIRISLGFNILLSLIILGAIGAGAYALNQYNKGTSKAANFALSHMYDYCDMAAKNLDTWIAEDDDNSYPPKEIQRQKLMNNTVCVSSDYAPFQEKAVNDYLKSKGLSINPLTDVN